MSTKARYSTDYEPPAPVLPVRVSRPAEMGGVGLQAVVDSGADLSILPEATARGLGLPTISRIRVKGVTGAAETALVHAASIELAGATFLAEVASFGDEAILGRDILSRLVVRLDGPRRTLEAHARRKSARSRRRRPSV